MDFRIVRKGYDTKETDDYILKITKEYEEELSKQKALILSLKDKLIELNDKVKEMDSKKQLVSAALIRAVEKAEETEKIAKQKLDAEISALKTFHVRWTSYYKKLIQKYPLDNELKKADEFTKKINETFLSPDEKDMEALEEFRRDHARVMGIKASSDVVYKQKKSEFEITKEQSVTDDIQSLLADIDAEI
ncbi:MAG: DivIVA domain-containing protein [Clostridia bacterium]|nr:DivIVA domain-containing protein [Clostridia bacterium]